MDTAEPGHMAESSTSWSLPPATQPQIIRAHQRDLFFLAAFKDQAEAVLRSFLGTRVLGRWEREADLLVRSAYLYLMLGRGVQTLGEEYTDVYRVSARSGQLPTQRLRAIHVALETIPPYLLSLLSRSSSTQQRHPLLANVLAILQTILGTAADVNLALFYFQGKYYSLLSRILALRPHTMSPPEPGVRPPSYGLLGILLSLRLAHRLYTFLSAAISTPEGSGTTVSGRKGKVFSTTNQTFLDAQPLARLLAPPSDEKPPDHLYIPLTSLTPQQCASRRCVLCLEERTASAATSCGHMFCWSCVSEWVREKPECPLCRQRIDMQSLVPIYNL